MIKRILLSVLLVTPLTCGAGQLITNATILEVANTNNNGPDFAIRMEGGSGVCASSTWISFPENKKQSDDSYKQAFSIALTALTTGKKVRIHNFEDDSCSGANFISISN